MFGMIRPCRHTLTPALRSEWMGHLCGLCYALRDDHGQAARLATNYDGLVISVLLDAQAPRSRHARRTAGPCPLRGMRRQSVATGEGARLAATVSLILASAQLSDHATDGDYGSRLVTAAARRVAGTWARRASGTAADLGLDAGVLLDAVARQPALEHPGSALLAVTEPTETATATAFAHTATLAGRPENAAALAEVGGLFGRLAHLLDAVEDLREDAATGAWNPLAATGTDLAAARTLADDAALGIRLALDEVTWTHRRLAHRLLVHELDRAIGHAFAHASADEGDTKKDEGPRRGPTRGLVPGCAAAAGLFCTCQMCCADTFPHPWTGEPVEGWCRNETCDGCCDCTDVSCDCCDCCSSCDCCDC
ncbi:DUF5685 family protein [Pseudonocardia sp. WMMC193]|uniref:DUF5685 family protein n=1 Tax=Pseudonocardia sp. WMMC193 TaxID=2911965 RepID=UPI001F40035A|nr:DUF5685 family protein [Pseudonocardia sp. WMMC193]